MAGKYAFGEFTFDSTFSDPQVVFRLVHDAGDVLYELETHTEPVDAARTRGCFEVITSD